MTQEQKSWFWKTYQILPVIITTPENYSVCWIIFLEGFMTGQPFTILQDFFWRLRHEHQRNVIKYRYLVSLWDACPWRRLHVCHWCHSKILLITNKFNTTLHVLKYYLFGNSYLARTEKSTKIHFSFKSSISC